MGRTTRIVLLILGIALIIFNLITVDYNDLWSSKSQIAWIGVIAGVCAILIVLINQSALRVQSEIKKRSKEKDQKGAQDQKEG
jgi:uncharacterized membrane protein